MTKEKYKNGLVRVRGPFGVGVIRVEPGQLQVLRERPREQRKWEWPFRRSGQKSPDRSQ